jgi:hypothetical protein
MLFILVLWHLISNFSRLMGTQRRLYYLGFPSTVFALLIPYSMPITHVHRFALALLISLPTTYTYESSLMFPRLQVAQTTLFRTQVSYSFLISCWFWLMLVPLVSCWFNVSQGEPMAADWLACKCPPSPYNTAFFHTQSAVLASCWSLAWFTILPWRWRRYVAPKCQLTFIELHSIIF